MGVRIYQAKWQMNKIQEKQNGLCNYCQKPIMENEHVVARHSTNVKWYHNSCAKRLLII